MHHLAQRLEDADVVLFPVARHPVDLQLLVDLGSKRHGDLAVAPVEGFEVRVGRRARFRRGERDEREAEREHRGSVASIARRRGCQPQMHKVCRQLL